MCSDSTKRENIIRFLSDLPEEIFSLDCEALCNDDLNVLEKKLSKVMKFLTGREERILRLRFGLDDGRVRSRDEVAKEFGYDETKITILEGRALKKIKDDDKSKRIREFLGDLYDLDDLDEEELNDSLSSEERLLSLLKDIE